MRDADTNEKSDNKKEIVESIKRKTFKAIYRMKHYDVSHNDGSARIANIIDLNLLYEKMKDTGWNDKRSLFENKG